MARLWRLQVLMLVGIFGFVSLAVAWSWARDSNPWVPIADLDDVSAERPLFDEETKVYVIKAPDGILALLGVGPWRAEKVEFCVSSKLFEAPVSVPSSTVTATTSAARPRGE